MLPRSFDGIVPPSAVGSLMPRRCDIFNSAYHAVVNAEEISVGDVDAIPFSPLPFLLQGVLKRTCIIISCGVVFYLAPSGGDTSKSDCVVPFFAASFVARRTPVSLIVLSSD